MAIEPKSIQCRLRFWFCKIYPLCPIRKKSLVFFSVSDKSYLSKLIRAVAGENGYLEDIVVVKSYFSLSSCFTCVSFADLVTCLFFIFKSVFGSKT